ncbi:MAG: histidine kinase [Lachnospiraceae bacterium]
MIRLLKWYYGSANLRNKLLISYSLLVLLPVLFMGIYSYQLSRDSFLEQTRLSMEDAAASMKVGLEGSISREDDNLRYLTYNADLRERLERYPEDATAFTKTLTEDVKPVFWYFITSDRNLNWIRLYSPYLERSIEDFCYSALLVEKEDWYQKSITYFKTIWRVEEENIYASRTLLDAGSSSMPIGVVELELSLKKLTQPICQIDTQEGGTLLLNSQGEVIFKSPFVNKELESRVEKYIQTELPQKFTETDHFLLSEVQEISNGWKFYYFRDRSAIDWKLKEIQLTTILLILVSFALLMLLGSLVSRVLTRRILRLQEAAEEISRGNFHVSMDLRYDDEIGVVNKSFEKMQQRMNEMIEETYRLGMEKRKVELQALQAKINPHFLYNCLSSIKWKAIKKNEEDIANITGLLAKFYRSTLNNGRAITTVENELQTIISYLELQQSTHDNGFDVILKLQEEGRELLMPNFLLQPLVENAIFHGVDCLEEENLRGRIEFSYFLKEKYLIFQVRNNGPEMDTLSLQENLSHPGRGYGLFNIRERIRLYYDDSRCGVSGQVDKDGMVCFTVCLEQKLKAIDLEQDEKLINR